MLISIKMRNWRKHTDKTVNFTSGLNAIRGANEAGKSSLIYAIIYALWGVKALPMPLSEMVTWGRDEKEARVEMVIQIGGEMYAYSRHKGGAEINHSGGSVTGQDEVSNFSTKLLGVDAKMAQSLMFASQKAMSGAMEAGPTALNEYIEGLAGMDLFDTLMELISEKWTTGPTAKLDATVAELETKIDAGPPAEPVYDDMVEAIEKETVLLRGAEAALETAQVDAKAANDVYTETKAKAAVRDAAVKNLKDATEALGRKAHQRAADLNTVETTVVNPDRIVELERLVADAVALEATKRAHTAFSKLRVPEDIWEGDEASLKAEIEAVGASIRSLNKQHTTASADARVLEGQIVTASVCGFCQQDMSQFPEVAKKNATLTEQVAAKKAEAKRLVGEETEKLEELGILKAVLASADPFNAFLRQFGQYVEVNDQHVPPVVTWKGEPPADGASAETYSTELLALKAAATRVAAAKTRLEQIEKDIEESELLVERLERSIPEEVDLDSLYQKKMEADTALAEAQKAVAKHRTTIQNLEAIKSQRLAEFKLAQRSFAQLTVTLNEARAERDELVATNALVKKIKAARPAIAAQLWDVVLASASVMFTNMRGEQSLITRTPKDFLVNGKTYKGLSGSATDLMGYAIRVALLKTFIPDCSFMIMDEATAACDDNRTMSLFGFIASAGFPQTLLVTHDPAAESVADSVIMI